MPLAAGLARSPNPKLLAAQKAAGAGHCVEATLRGPVVLAQGLTQALQGAGDAARAVRPPERSTTRPRTPDLPCCVA
jgi:hypothetical protein